MTTIEIITSPYFWIGTILGVIIGRIIVNIIIKRIDR